MPFEPLKGQRELQ